MAQLKLTLGAELAEVTRMREAVEAFAAAAALPEPVAFKLTLALDELVANAINHGLTGVALPEIHVHIGVDADVVTVRLRDNGIMFDPFLEAPDPELDTPLAERSIGGLGVHLVRTLMDRVDYRREGEYNCIELSVRLDQPDTRSEFGDSR